MMNVDINNIIIWLGILLFVVGIILLALRDKAKDAKKAKSNKTAKSSGVAENPYKKNPDASIAKDDIFKFMEFETIQDNMIIQQKGEKYTAVIKCKGINYNLMSEIEQLSVEEGFMNFLNTLKFPIQIYVQAQTINLRSNIAEYRENMKYLIDEYEDVNLNYNSVLNSLESTDEEIQEVEDKRNSILNVVEYGSDIVKYVEKLALNKNLLQRSFYILVSYYKSELSNAASFNKEELLDICYSELFTRAQNIMSGLSMSSVTSSILSSNEIAELLYSAYNRDDKNYMSVQQALDAGFYRLYSTSEDAVTKKNRRLVENMKREAEYKAIVALNKAMDEGELVTEADIADAYDQETSKQAIELVKREKVSEKVKQDAKKIIVDEYKKAKKERIEKQAKEVEKVREKIQTIKAQQAVAEKAEVPEAIEVVENAETVVASEAVEPVKDFENIEEIIQQESSSETVQNTETDTSDESIV